MRIEETDDIPSVRRHMGCNVTIPVIKANPDSPD
jgi:hypothetical protein